MDVIEGFYEATPELMLQTLNNWPCYANTGARVASISSDFRDWRVVLPLNEATRNLVGTTYGGSMYGAVDPILMLAYLRILGPGWTVWDKGATIRFLRPGRGDLEAQFQVTQKHLEDVRSTAAQQAKFDRTFAVALTDADGVPHCVVDKVLHFRGPAAG